MSAMKKFQEEMS